MVTRWQNFIWRSLIALLVPSSNLPNGILMRPEKTVLTKPPAASCSYYLL